MMTYKEKAAGFGLRYKRRYPIQKTAYSGTDLILFSNQNRLPFPYMSSFVIHLIKKIEINWQKIRCK
jgi:hypothetical protein